MNSLPSSAHALSVSISRLLPRLGRRRLFARMWWRGLAAAAAGGLGAVTLIAQDQAVSGNLTVTGNATVGGTTNATTLIATSGIVAKGPGNAVVIYGSNGSPAYMQIDQTPNSGKIWRVGHTGAASGYGTFDIYNQTDNITAISIASWGNVGIGMPGNGYKLAVAGDTQVAGGQLILSGVNANGINAVGLTLWGGTNGGGLYARGDASGGDDMFEATAIDGFKFTTLSGGTNERMRITSAGNVGIGTPTPNFLLTVDNTSGADNYPLVVTNTLQKSNSNYLGVQLMSKDVNYLSGGMRLWGNPSATNRRLELYAYEEGAGPANVVVPFGNFGIGTPSPGNKLEVAGNALVQGSDGFNATDKTASLFVGDGNSYVRAIFDRGMTFGQNGVERMRIQGVTGNVGIGTPLPMAKLDVAGDIIASGNITLAGRLAAGSWSGNSFSGGTSGLTLDAGGNNQNISLSGTGNGGIISQRTGQDAWMRLESDTEQAFLELKGASGETNGTAVGGHYAGVSMKAKSETVGNYGTIENINLGGFLNGRINFVNLSHVDGAGAIDIYSRAAGSGSNLERVARFDASTLLLDKGSLTGGATGLALQAGGSDQNITLNPSGAGYTLLGGKVGIGTTTAISNLDVVKAGGVPVTSTDSIQWVGIFNNNNGGASIARVGIYSGPTGQALLNFGSSDPDIGGLSYDNNDNSLAFRTNNAEWARITSSGYVGIGTTNPGSLLSVRSMGADGNYKDVLTGLYVNDVEKNSIQTAVSTTPSESGFRFLVSNGGGSPGQTVGYQMNRDAHHFFVGGAEKLTVDPAGKVGIGTTTPAAKLEIANVNGSTGIGNVVPRAGLFAISGGGSLGLALGHDTTANRPYLQSTDGINAFSMSLNPYGGDVGIGVGDPHAKLDVAGDTNIATALTVGGSATIAGPLAASAGATLGGTTSMATASVSGTSTFGGNLNFQSVVPGTPPTTTAVGGLSWSAGASNPLSLTAGASRSLYLSAGNSTTGGLTISASGNFSLGTATANSLLTLGTAAPVITADTSDAADNKYIAIAAGGANDTTRGATIEVSGNERAANPGNVLIRAGNVAGGDIRLGTGGVDDRVVITDTGNVGIGLAAAPAAKLDVSGSGKFSADVAIGGDVSISSNTLSSSSQTGALTVLGGAGIGGNLNVGAAIMGSTVTATQGTVAGGASGLTLNAGGSGQAVNINASGGDINIGTGGAGGDVRIGNSARNTISGNLRPLANNSYNLGASGARWANGFFSNTVYAGSLVAETGVVRGDSSGLSLTAGSNNEDISLNTGGSGNVIINNARLGIGTASSTTLTQKLQFGVGNFVGLPGSQPHVPAAWQRGLTGIILAGAQNADGSGWAFGSRAVSVDQGDGLNLEIDVLRAGGWTNAALVVSGRNGKEGNVGIGTSNPTHKLSVNGTIRAREVLVESAPWPDYVFKEGYHNVPLSEVEAHIKEHKHLPGVPSARQIEENGVSVGEMQGILLRKVEELTLHMIAQEKRIKQLEEENAALRVTRN